MANHSSAEKRNRQRITRTVRARSIKHRVRTALKQARAAVAAKDAGAAELVRKANSLLDRAAAKHVLPGKRVARIKSRLVKSSQA